jgi:Cu-Zn family superoxide dismutase
MRAVIAIVFVVTVSAPQAVEAAQASTGPSVDTHRSEPPVAQIDMLDLQGSKLGEIRVRETSSGLLIDVDLHDVPTGTHGFHVHAVGRCEPPFESAGSHLAPQGHDHGFLATGGPHGGDLVNLEVGDDGRIRQTLRAPDLSMADLRDQDGAAFVLHESADDYTTQPSGASGKRIGCARIGPAQKSAQQR